MPETETTSPELTEDIKREFFLAKNFLELFPWQHISISNDEFGKVIHCWDDHFAVAAELLVPEFQSSFPTDRKEILSQREVCQETLQTVLKNITQQMNIKTREALQFTDFEKFLFAIRMLKDADYVTIQATKPFLKIYSKLYQEALTISFAREKNKYVVPSSRDDNFSYKSTFRANEYYHYLQGFYDLYEKYGYPNLVRLSVAENGLLEFAFIAQDLEMKMIIAPFRIPPKNTKEIERR